jgi:hypothetical protein
MKIGKINSRLQRFGQKARSDISKAVGKTSKVIGQAERGINRGITEVSKVADSAAVKGIQQATGLAGKALVATGNPYGMAAGGALLGAYEGIKATRKAIPDKVESAKKQVGGVARQARAEVLKTATGATGLTRKADEFRKNVLERPEPKANLMDERLQYVD